MPSLSTPAATLMVIAGLVGTWLGGAGHTRRLDMRTSTVAALAWAQLRCDSSLELANGSPRIQSEDLMLANAAFEADTALRGTKAVCADALTIAESVASLSTVRAP